MKVGFLMLGQITPGMAKKSFVKFFPPFPKQNIRGGDDAFSARSDKQEVAHCVVDCPWGLSSSACPISLHC